MYAIYTNELIESRKRRMPWRTVLELAKAWGGIVFTGDLNAEEQRSRAGEQGERVVNAEEQRSRGGEVGVDNRYGGGDCSIDGVTVVPVVRPFSGGAAEALVAVMRERGVTRLYYPIGPGRDYAALQMACDAAKIELVWYMSSSWNSVPRVLRAWKWMGFGSVRPYLIQALIPKRWWIRRLNRLGVRPLITMSPFTARAMIAAGYPADKVHPILPGLDPLPSLPTIKQSEQSNNRTIPYFLFFGPPQPIRGIYLILEAVKRLAKKRQDFRFIPLVRADENAKAELERLKTKIQEVNDRISHLCCSASQRFGNAEEQRSRVGEGVDGKGDGVIQPVYGLVSPEEIEAYIEGAVAILKPFVLVPSEIPLAPMEAMQREKMVIGFDGDGTGELIAEHGIAVRHCDVEALVEAMEERLRDCSDRSSDRLKKWMTWGEVAERWRRGVSV